MAWHDQVTAALTCATNSHVESRKPFPVDHLIVNAPVMFFTSDHSTAPRLPPIMKCDRGNSSKAPRTIVPPSLWWAVCFGESSPGFLH